MPELIVRRLFPTSPELALLERKIIAQRNEYASWDFAEYQHIYLGFIEGGIETFLRVLETEVTSTRAIAPASTFTLEYHPSCISHSEHPFLVQSFTLIKRFPSERRQTRQLMILSWKLPLKGDYTDENTMIEQFMKQMDIQPYDDGSGIPCRIEPDKKP